MIKHLVPKSALMLAAAGLLLGLAGCGPQFLAPQTESAVSPLQAPTTTPQWDGAHPPTPPATDRPEDATRVAEKVWHTPEPDEIAAAATEMAERSQPYIPPPPKPEPSYPVKSLDDIPKVVLNDPYFQEDVNDPIFGPCVKEAKPGAALFVKALDEKRPDYYVVPFFKDEQVCGVAMVGVKDGVGVMGGWSGADYKQYPLVSADEAVALVEKAGHQVAGKPRLAFRRLREGTNDFFPFWEVFTTDGQTFYVVDTRGTVMVWNAADVHPLR